VGTRANFEVGVVVCGDDDLLLIDIFMWTGDICDDAERVDVSLAVISLSVCRTLMVRACLCVCGVCGV